MTESPPDSGRPGAGAALAGLAQEAWDAEMAASRSSRPRSAIAGSTTGSGRTAPSALAADVATASSLIARAEAIDPAAPRRHRPRHPGRPDRASRRSSATSSRPVSRRGRSTRSTGRRSRS